MSELVLAIGNRNYSSWSLRAWLAVEQTGLPFREEIIGFDEDIDVAIRKQRDEQMTKEGSAQAHHFAACNAIDDIALTLVKVETRASVDDLDADEEDGGPGHNRRTRQAATDAKKGEKKAGKTRRKKRSKNGVPASEA